MNELIGCVEELVKETELDNPDLAHAVDRFEKNLYINITELKYNKKCQAARVFKYLFKLNGVHTDPWKWEEMKKDKNGRLTILSNFDITKEEWNKFIYFLRHKHPPFFGAWMTTRVGNMTHENYYNKIIKWLEDVNVVCNKLGGFPIFDTYYKKFWEGNIANEAFGTCVPPSNFNLPRNPEEDIHDKYLWENFIRASTRHMQFSNNLLQISKNWSIASIDKNAAGPDHIWYKRLK